MRGGVELRQAAATAREALLAMAAERLQLPVAELTLADGEVRARGRPQRRRRRRWSASRGFDVKMNPKAPLKRPAQYVLVGKPLPRPDVPAKVTGRHVYVHDHVVPGMLHGRVLRPPAVGAKVEAVDESSVAGLPGVRVVRIADFVGVVAGDEWAAVRAARELKVRWSDERAADRPRRGRRLGAQRPVRRRGESSPPRATRSASPRSRGAADAHPRDLFVADPVARLDRPVVRRRRRARRRRHGLDGVAGEPSLPRNVFAALVDLPRDKLRVIYLDGAGCYGMNGHDDAAADAVLLSKAVGKPVRVQWSREDELGWDPKGPPQLLELRATLTADGRIDAWETEMWVPRATANLEWVPLLAPLAAGMRQPVGQSVGLVSQNGDPPYAANAVKVSAHWLGPAPLRPSNIRAPGKVANCFAVESFVDELAAKAQARSARVSPARPRRIRAAPRCCAGWRS